MTSTPNRYTDGSYAAATVTWHDEDSPFKAKWLTNFLEDLGVRPASVCDVGCGVGGILAELKLVWPEADLVGYDISEEATAMARSLNPGVDVRCGNPPLGGPKFDLSLFMDVFEHVEDYLGFLRRMRNLSAQMVFHIPLDMTALTVLRERPLVYARAKVGHLHYFCKATALATLEDAGYEILASRYTPGTIELPNSTVARRLAAWPRRAGFKLAPDLTARTLGGYSLLVLARPC